MQRHRSNLRAELQPGLTTSLFMLCKIAVGHINVCVLTCLCLLEYQVHFPFINAPPPLQPKGKYLILGTF